MDYFREGFGLVTEHDKDTENCNLFYAEYLLLKKEITEEDKQFFSKNMQLKVNSAGLYNRRSIEENPPRSVSKDEILGFLVASKILNTEHGKEIWKHLITHFGTYNNRNDWFGRVPYNPGCFYSWGQLVNSKLSYLFLPIFIINLIIACNQNPQATSSKIMYWVEFKSMPGGFINNLLCRYFERKMKKQYGENYINQLFEIYFNMESRTEFPIFKELLC